MFTYNSDGQIQSYGFVNGQDTSISQLYLYDRVSRLSKVEIEEKIEFEFLYNEQDELVTLKKFTSKDNDLLYIDSVGITYYEDHLINEVTAFEMKVGSNYEFEDKTKFRYMNGLIHVVCITYCTFMPPRL